MEYVPKKINSRLAAFAVEIEPCAICNKDMVSKPIEYAFSNGNTFPICTNSFDSQVKAGGFVIRSNATIDGEYICKDCASKGLADFECDLCNKRYPTSDIKKSIGDPADYLCVHCYASCSAKIWDEAVNQLEDEHRYDFE